MRIRICIDTNVLLRLFGTQGAFADIKQGLMIGRIELAVSTPILMEYEEVVTRLSGVERWRTIDAFLNTLIQLHGNIIPIEPQYRFHVITNDPDDNKFVDCAIVARADFVVTADRDFAPLNGAGYQPKAITPEEFVSTVLASPPTPVG